MSAFKGGSLVIPYLSFCGRNYDFVKAFCTSRKLKKYEKKLKGPVINQSKKTYSADVTYFYITKNKE